MLPDPELYKDWAAWARALKAALGFDQSISTETFRGALVRKNTDQTGIGPTFTAITWQTVIYDTDKFYAVSNPTKLTIPAEVTWVRFATCTHHIGGIADTRILLRKNGVDFPGQPAVSQTSGLSESSLSFVSPVLRVVPGDYFEIYATNSIARTIANDTKTWFAVEVIK
jgi:hypothetical protein